MSRLGDILDIDLVLDDSDVFMQWRRRNPRFEARRLNRRFTDESCTVGECIPNVSRGRPQQIDRRSINTHSFRCKKEHITALLHDKLSSRNTQSHWVTLCYP
ncbi:hypothetical protein DPMN_147412 [Dreissena polymorpha]|uniref:Uncharacterized protein n=1 Tax=Dreissena polymorpha TaxID=45954 RepID=A0A9D4FAH4_DREPO|nr:hypothetical protein DPMN_147412 [Dreissena polymorpha]